MGMVITGSASRAFDELMHNRELDQPEEEEDEPANLDDQDARHGRHEDAYLGQVALAAESGPASIGEGSHAPGEPVAPGRVIGAVGEGVDHEVAARIDDPAPEISGLP